MSNRNVAVTKKRYKADRADIVIVGNGIAGLTAAVEARRLAPHASIVIITAQSHPTINTPALKQFAIGKLTQEQLLAYPAGTELAQRIHVINAYVEGINAQEKFLSLAGGKGFGYDSLLLATGSKATGLPQSVPGSNFDGVITLHCLEDYLDLRRRLPEVNDAVVIGGGAHAIETVMGLLHLGIQVHWLLRGKTFLSRILDTPASEMVLENIRHAGATVYTETEIQGIVGRVGSVIGVVTNHDQMIPCQLVATCTGTTPVTRLAEQCSIIHKHGIQVDDQLRTSTRDIYAAGAVAALKNPQTGAYETRPLWYAGVLQGRTVAAMMTHHEELAAQPFGVPWHATHLGDLCMLSVGDLHNMTDDLMTLTDSSKRSYRRMSFIGDRLVSYLSLGPTQPDSLAIKRIIDEGLSIRDIQKDLLKGNFDARKYFSRQQSHAVCTLITSGKLPTVHWIHSSTPVSRPVVISPTTSHKMPTLPKTDGSLAIPVLRQVTNLASTKLGPHTEPLHDAHPLTNERSQQPDTEEILPFTGKLPAFPEQIIDTEAIPAPTPQAPRRGLRSYSTKLPTVSGRQTTQGNRPPLRMTTGQFKVIGG
jgi:NAD(P)H-nitrite reductase large subunit